MSEPARYNNQLLSFLPEAELDAIRPHLWPVQLEQRFPVQSPNRSIEYVYFPETGLISILASGGKGLQLEVGMAGYEGMSGFAVVLGNDRSPEAFVVQVPCQAQRLPVTVLQSVMASSISLRLWLMKYAHSVMIQMAHTSLAHGQATVEERLARWLLMAQDRLGAEIALSHDQLALVLGVRRASVTVALQQLESQGSVRNYRRRICVTSRDTLMQIARGLYGVPESEYRRLTGCPPPAWDGRRRPRLPVEANSSVYGLRQSSSIASEQF